MAPSQHYFCQTPTLALKISRAQAKVKSKHFLSGCHLCCDPTVPWRQSSSGSEAVFNAREEHTRGRTGCWTAETSPAVLTRSSCCLLLIQSVSKQLKTQQNTGQADVGQGLCACLNQCLLRQLQCVTVEQDAAPQASGLMHVALLSQRGADFLTSEATNQ